jgi:hypothetical protein
MDDRGALATMPPKQPKKRKAAGGRPKAPEPLQSLISLKGTTAFASWIDGLVDHAHLGTRTLLLKNALRVFAEQQKYEEPMPKR